MHNASQPSTEDARRMLETFRVQELQSLLIFADLSHHGKKSELIARALNLIKTNKSFPLFMKIRQLHRQRFSEERAAVELVQNANSSVNQNNLVAAKSLANMNHQFLTNYGGVGYGVPADPAYGSSNAALPITPDVKLVRLPFYDVVQVMLRPQTLQPRSAQRFQENFFTFTLTPQQVKDINYNDNAPFPRYELQMRFTLLDTSTEQKDDFPPGTNVRMNDKVVQLPNPIPTNKPGVEPKRPSRPVNITPYCRLTPTTPQRIGVTWAVEPNKNWTVSIYYVQRVNTDILLQRLKEKGIRREEYTKAMIKEKLAHDDQEIATTSLRVSLQCPLGKMRMSIPCKVQDCQHLQCFDAYNFLAMNEKRPTWVCAVCDKPAPYDQLIVDGFFTKVMNESDSEVSEVQVHENGEWTPLIRDDDNNAVPAPNKKRLPNQAVAEIAVVESPSSSKQETGSTTSQKETASAPPDEVLIDLTESDEEDSSELSATVSTAVVSLQKENAVVSSSLSGTTTGTVPKAAGAGSATPTVIELDFDSPPSNHSNQTPEDPVPIKDMTSTAGSKSLSPNTFAPNVSAAGSVSAITFNGQGGHKRSVDFVLAPAKRHAGMSGGYSGPNQSTTGISVAPSAPNLPSSPRSVASSSAFAFAAPPLHQVSYPTFVSPFSSSSTHDFPPLPTLKAPSALDSYPTPHIMSSTYGGVGSISSCRSVTTQNQQISGSGSIVNGISGSTIRSFYNPPAQANQGPPPLRYGPTHTVIRPSTSQQQYLQQAIQAYAAQSQWQSTAFPQISPYIPGALSAAMLGDIGQPFEHASNELQEFLQQCINDPGSINSRRN